MFNCGGTYSNHHVSKDYVTGLYTEMEFLLREVRTLDFAQFRRKSAFTELINILIEFRSLTDEELRLVTCLKTRVYVYTPRDFRLPPRSR